MFKDLPEWLLFMVVIILASGMSGFYSYSSNPSPPNSSPEKPISRPTTPIDKLCCDPETCWETNISRDLVGFAQNINPSLSESPRLAKTAKAITQYQAGKVSWSEYSNNVSKYSLPAWTIQQGYAFRINTQACGDNDTCKVNEAWGFFKSNTSLATKINSGLYDKIGSGHCDDEWSVYLGKE